MLTTASSRALDNLFLSVLDPDGKVLLYSTYFGGAGDEQGLYGLARDTTGGIFMGAASRPGNYPLASQPERAAAASGWDGVLTKLNMGPLISPGWVRHAASYAAGRVAPGLIAVVYGEFFGPAQIATMEIENRQVNTVAGDTKIYFDNVAAPVVYSLNFGTYSAVSTVAPWEVAGKATTKIQVEYRNLKGNTITVPVVAALPGLFTANQSGTGQGAFLNLDWTLNSAANAVERGGWIQMYGTGGGVTNPTGVTGSFSAYPPLYALAGDITVTTCRGHRQDRRPDQPRRGHRGCQVAATNSPAGSGCTQPTLQ
ncbi:MAG TPA: hypothetical protein VLH09_11465 [Bryobacteraceae bacterium]|nr:hypothetical protein [Bryobacteraceae bacterium]